MISLRKIKPVEDCTRNYPGTGPITKRTVSFKRSQSLFRVLNPTFTVYNLCSLCLIILHASILKYREQYKQSMLTDMSRQN